MDILEIIQSSCCEDTAVTSKEISFLTGLSGVEIRAEVHQLRVMGIPICSCNKGYYYSRKATDISKTIYNLKQRAISMLEVIEGLKKADILEEEES